jgi:hypothetical protein
MAATGARIEDGAAHHAWGRALVKPGAHLVADYTLW